MLKVTRPSRDLWNFHVTQTHCSDADLAMGFRKPVNQSKFVPSGTSGVSQHSCNIAVTHGHRSPSAVVCSPFAPQVLLCLR